ncbi:GMP synthase-Glutamine amidotransferase [Ruegeria halocynthiae]|uniref:GMP synthase-Glutamine amidotransferase n=1 Tax=Ruegeria halocynthiae TaxID=985054 RepID=A0A1H3EQ55_9RHOB|nr:type 1 glutamine amidotransferase [Ruegeria halocynthiae]SDX80770.1 GMP synthase-Glutamine amidotransferase [Ruegeria halocynthiae]
MQIVHLYKGQSIPLLDDFDLSLVMGGPMDVWENGTHPWLKIEKQAIRTWVRDLNRPYFGICLGHQLLIDTLGGTCARMQIPEIGVLSVELTDNAREDPLFASLPRRFPVLQWHGVTATVLPPDTAVLAGSERCAVQAIRVGNCTWGVQFHPEIIQVTISTWMGDKGNHQCAVDWLGSTNAALAMENESDQIAADQFRMTSEIYSALRQF